MSSIFGEATVKARKRHRCYWCDEHIEPGETYEKWCWRDGGDFDVVTVHPECKAAWGDAAKREGDPYYETFAGEHSRGCCCPHGQCECKVSRRDAEPAEVKA